MIYVVVIVLVIEVEDVLVYHISVYVSYILIIKQRAQKRYRYSLTSFALSNYCSVMLLVMLCIVNGLEMA